MLDLLLREALDRLCVRLNMYLVSDTFATMHSDTDRQTDRQTDR